MRFALFSFDLIRDIFFSQGKFPSNCLSCIIIVSVRLTVLYDYLSVELNSSPLFILKKANVANYLYLYFLSNYEMNKKKNHWVAKAAPCHCHMWQCDLWVFMTGIKCRHRRFIFHYFMLRCFYQGQTCSCQGHCHMERKPIKTSTFFYIYNNI